MNDKDIIRGCLRGDVKSQYKLYNKYFSQMKGVVHKYFSDDENVSEIIQLGFIKVYNNIHKYENTGPLGAWMRRIFINTSIDYIRRKKSNNKMIDNNISDYHFNSIVSEEDVEEFDPQIIMNAIKHLSPQYRTIFNLYVIEEYSHKEIAKMLNISEGTSKSNLFKAKNVIRKLIK